MLYINAKNYKSQIENWESKIGSIGAIIVAMKKVISFDLDGTLVDARYGDAVWNQGIPEEYAKKYSVPLDEAKEFIINKYRAIGDGNILWYEIQYWLEKFDLPVSTHELLKRFESHIEPLPHARDVLNTLSKKYILIVASNAARIFVEKELHYADLTHFFTHVVSATTDYGMVKKGAEFYKRLCGTLNISPSEIVHVGDHPVFDFDAPLSLGIEAYYLDSQGSGARYQGPVKNNGHVIYNLKELLDKV